MLAKDVTPNFVTNDFKEVFMGRRSARTMDPNVVISRDEIKQIFNEANVAAPSAVDAQPWRFLICDTDESKEKLDTIMRIADKNRVTACSFAIVVLADRDWFTEYDETLEHNKVDCPGFWNDDFLGVFMPVLSAWDEELHEVPGYLDRSISFQAGLITMALMYAARAHGYDTGFMDSWDPDLVGEYFDIDIERFVPEGVVCFGKNAGELYDSWRRDAEDNIIWG